MRRPGERFAVLALAALVLLPRAALVARAHSECYDDEYHLVRGARFWRGTLAGMAESDPPFGEALTALPAVLTNHNPAWTGTLYDHSEGPERVLLLTALWRSLLFLPAVGIAFVWCRRLYGRAAGWMAAVLLVAEPTFAAHVPLPALDALGVVGVLCGVFFTWRFFARPEWGRLLLAGAAIGFGLSLKSTSILLPLVALGYAGLVWGVRPWREGTPFAAWRAALPSRLLRLAAGAAVAGLTVWALTLFDVSVPDLPPDWRAAPSLLTRALDRPLPAGMYLGSIVRGQWHAGLGHAAYLFGEKSQTGWWYYFPAVLTYKMPIGIAVVLLLALLSLRAAAPRFEEWGLLLPAASWTLLMLASRIDIGLRHFLPAYVFLLLLGSRSVAAGDGAAPGGPAAGGTAPGEPPPGVSAPVRRAAGGWRARAAWGALLVAAIDAASWHPDYLSYLNLPRRHAWLDISDSNLDWGQGLKQARDWIDARGRADGRPIYLLYFGDANSPRRAAHYLDGRVTMLWKGAPLPRTGLVIASPVWVAGPFDRGDTYAALRRAEPLAVIGHSLLVFDLDRLAAPP